MECNDLAVERSALDSITTILNQYGMLLLHHVDGLSLVWYRGATLAKSVKGIFTMVGLVVRGLRVIAVPGDEGRVEDVGWCLLAYGCEVRDESRREEEILLSETNRKDSGTLTSPRSRDGDDALNGPLARNTLQ